MDSELFRKVIQGVKAVAGVKTLLVLPVAALHLAVMTRRVGADELMADTQLGGGGLKQSGKIPLAVGKTVGELKSIVSLDTFHLNTPAGIPFNQPYKEVGGGIGGLFRVGGQEAQACELVNGCVLVQAQLRVSDAATGDHLHIHLDTLAGIGHLLVGLWLVGGFLLFRLEQAQLSHDPEQALRAAGVAPLPQPVPQFHHTQVGIAAAHIPDQLLLCLCMLVRVAVGSPGLADQ